jgi:hypothetical protein
MGALERHTRDRPDTRPYAYFTDVARNALLRARASLNLEVEVVLRMAAEAPKATCNEFFLMVLIFLSTAPGRFLPIRNDLKEERTGI